MEPLHQVAPSGRQIMVGEMCPQGAAGRPGVAPLILRTIGWTDNANEVDGVIERGGVPRFAVLGLDGKTAGVFDTVGLAEVGARQQIASGTYVGAPPCSTDVGKDVPRKDDPKCTQATNGCGLAVGEVTRPDDPPHTPSFVTGGICLSGDALAVDIDGDGVVESFPLAGVLDGSRGPAAEWSAAPTAGAACKPTFQLYGIRLVPEPDPGKKVDEKSVVILDVLGVVDLDGDGRREIVMALRFPTVRSIVVYSAAGSAQRLGLAGEATSFPPR
jgi:hypothetical protein